MDNVAEVVGQKVGSMVEGAVKGALNSANKNKDEKKGGGGIFSLFGGNKNKKKDKTEDKGASLPNVPNKDGSGGKKPAPEGFFSEGDLAGTPGGKVGPTMGGGAGGNVGSTMGGGAGGSGGSAGPVAQGGVTTDRDLMDDLFDLAEETKGN